MADLTRGAAQISDLDLAVATLLAKTKYYTTYFDYYEGRQPLVYSRQRLREIFREIDARFSQNWCAVVIDSVLERIQLQRITVADNEAQTAQLDGLLSASSLLLEADDTHLAALVTGEGYVIVWPDEETNRPEAYYNDPRNVHVFYEGDRPRVKRFACKWWIGDDNYRYLTLYYPDRLEYYRSRKAVRSLSRGTIGAGSDVSSAKAFEEPAIAGNPYGTIPVFHFRRDRRLVSSELQNVIEPQDAVNKLLADMMVAAEFGAFKQRWAITNADTSQLRNAPNIIWGIPPEDGEGQPASVGEFGITPLDNYIKAVDKWTTAIAIISRTPKHYFFGQGGDPSGEALIAMESPLNHKAQRYIDRFTAVWSEVAQFMLLLDGTTVDSNAIIPHFDRPETIQPYTQSLITKELVGAGVPLLWQMEQQGYTGQEIAALEEARQQEQQAAQARLAESMVNARRNFDRGGMDEDDG